MRYRVDNIGFKQTFIMHIKQVIFVCLLGFSVRAAIFQLYSDDEHKIDDKMNMK